MGGNLGLFVGMSIISLMEFFDYLFDVFLIILSPALFDWSHSKRRKRSVEDQQPKKVFIMVGPEDHSFGSGKLKW